MPKNDLMTAYALAKLREPPPPPPVDYRTLAALANEVPQPYTGGNTRNALRPSQWLNNLSIGLGYGGQNQLAGLEQTIRHPIDTAKALFQAVTHPVRTANALAGYVKQGVTSGPMGLGQLIGENIGLPRYRAPVMREMTAYHGSPHDFDAFDMSKIGTGEGAQAYGHGLYFAENPAVAKNYQKNLSYKDMVRQFRDAMPDDADMAEALDWAASGVAPPKMAEVIKELAKDDWLGFDYPSQALTALFREPHNFDISPDLQKAASAMKGALYNVDIPDEAIAKMLDWDAPLSQQPEAVRRFFEPLVTQQRAVSRQTSDSSWGDFAGPFEYDPTGSELMQILGRHVDGGGMSAGGVLSGGTGGQKASAMLNAAGIPGIKYYDGGSRSAGQGTRNFVVFDDKLPKILKKE